MTASFQGRDNPTELERRGSRLAMTVLAIVLVSALGVAQAQPSNEDYIFSIVKKRPAILASWSWIVPQKYASQRWIKQLDGTTGPVDRVVVAGKPFVLGSVCWPHNCGGNFVAFLVAADGSEAFGLLRSADLKAADEAFGNPDAQKRKMLADYLSRN